VACDRAVGDQLALREPMNRSFVTMTLALGLVVPAAAAAQNLPAIDGRLNPALSARTLR